MKKIIYIILLVAVTFYVTTMIVNKKVTTHEITNKCDKNKIKVYGIGKAAQGAGHQGAAIFIEQPERPERFRIRWKPSGSDAQIAYVNRFKKVAIAEMKKYGIPASISLAQGILESRHGQSYLAQNHNNHFGIKCHSKKCKRGHCTNREDDSHKDFFKSYQTAWLSWRDHSKVLQKDRYKSLYESKNYEDWAHGLQRCGYATSKTYGKDLISIIETLNLNYFDQL